MFQSSSHFNIFNIFELLAKPLFKKHNEIIDLYEGEDYLMECNTYEIPVPKIEWLVNGSSINFYHG